MTRKPLKREALSLDSPDWVPLTTAHAELSEQIGDRLLAARDFTEKLRKEGKGRIRSMVRCVSRDLSGRSPPAYAAMELPAGFWRAHEVDGRWSRLGVVPHPRRGEQPNFLEGVVFYVWKSDLKIFYPSRVASTASNEPMQKTPERRGRKPFPGRTILTVIAFALFERRRQGEPEKSQAAVIMELHDWCEQRKKKTPGPTTLAAIVKEAFDARVEWKTPPRS